MAFFLSRPVRKDSYEMHQTCNTVKCIVSLQDENGIFTAIDTIYGSVPEIN